MAAGIQYRDMIGGLGIFLFGMLVFEETISHLGKGFLKKFLEKYTNTRIKSICTGIIQTCIFQSSTIVTMMTLGFVGAGIIGLINALGVVIGANIGTTLTPWLITFLGFKIDIESFALPMIGIGGIATIIFSKSENIKRLATFLIGFGLLFLGLAYMKGGVDAIAQSVSLEQYTHMNIRGYVLIGTIITAIIQTSTGATVIVLTALYAKLITLDMALGIVIGANLGSAVSTTIIGLLSSTPTQTQKKQVALSHLIFNISTTLIVTIFYKPITSFILFIAGNGAENILILSIFHTTFNIILALIRTPLLSPLLRFLHYIIPPRTSQLHLAIDHVNTDLAEEVLQALSVDTKMLLGRVESYNRHVLYVDHLPHSTQKTQDMYVTIKQIEEKLLTRIIRASTLDLQTHDAEYKHLLNDSILSAITSSKYLKDIQHHLIYLKDESLTSRVAAKSLHEFQEMIIKTSDIIKDIDWTGNTESRNEMLQTHIQMLHMKNDEFLNSLSSDLGDNDLEGLHISEIIKTNRYVLLSCEEIIAGYMNLVTK